MGEAPPVSAVVIRDNTMNLVALRPRTDELFPSPESARELETISLKGFFSFLVRRRLLIGTVAAIAAALCLTAFLFQRPHYTATALVMINAGQDRTLQPVQSISGADISQNSPVVDSQLEVLRSPMLVSRLVDSLHLLQDPEWNAPGPAHADPDRVRQSVILAVSKAIDVRRRGLTYAVEVSATSVSSRRAAEMANRMVALFQQYQVESRLSSAERANTWLAARLGELREDVQQKEGAAERYRAQTGLLSTQGSLLSEQQTTQMQGELMQARADLAEKEARYQQLRQTMDSGGSADAIAGVLNSNVITQLRAQEADVARRQADLESRYGDQHPAVVNVRAERADIRGQINAEIARISSSLRSEVEVARARVATLQGGMSTMRGELVGNNEQLVTLRELEREATAARDVYEAFLQRYNEISDQGSLQSTAELVSSATVPTQPSSLRLSLALLLSIAVGLGFGMVAGFLAEALDEGFGDSEDVEAKVGVPALATIPKLAPVDLRDLPPSARHPAAYLLERPVSVFTEACRILRTTILFDAGRLRSQVVALTSAAPSEGKTTMSICLARVSAISGQRVLLVDCDLRRRSVKDVLDFEPATGLLQVLTGGMEWRKAIHVDEATGMHILPLSDSGFISKDVFGGEEMDRLIAELRGSYELIVLDCPPVLAVAEARVIVSKADCAIMVASWKKTPVRAVRTALRQLQDAGANVRGVALNGVHRRAPGYYSYPMYDARA